MCGYNFSENALGAAKGVSDDPWSSPKKGGSVIADCED